MSNTEYTWDDLYERALNRGCFSPELRAKDEARGQLRELILEELSHDIEQDECSEDAIDKFLFEREKPVLFDIYGNIIRC